MVAALACFLSGPASASSVSTSSGSFDMPAVTGQSGPGVCTPGTTTSHGPVGADLKGDLLSSCEIPPYGKSVVNGGWSAAQGTTPFSVTCPAADLSKVPSLGFASTIFSPDSTSAPELFEQLVDSTTGGSEYTGLLKTLKHCSTFVPQIASRHGTLRTISLPRYGEQSQGFLQSIPFNLGPLPSAVAKFDRGHHLTSAPTKGTLLTGSVLIHRGRYLLVVAFFPSTSRFTASQLKPYIEPALAKVPG
jgi:hypothetical protein